MVFPSGASQRLSYCGLGNRNADGQIVNYETWRRWIRASGADCEARHYGQVARFTVI